MSAKTRGGRGSGRRGGPGAGRPRAHAGTRGRGRTAPEGELDGAPGEDAAAGWEDELAGGRGEADHMFEPTFEDFGAAPEGAGALTGSIDDVRPAAAGARATGAPGSGDDGDAAILDDGSRADAPLELGRVIRLDRGYPLVCTASGTYRSEHAIALVKGAGMRACVGDWVALRLPSGHDKALIERILPRRGVLSRWDGKRQGERQTLASNLDVVLVVQPLSGRPISADRVARSAVLAREGGCGIAVVLTKADRAPEDLVARDVAILRACLGEELPVFVVSALEGRGVEEVRAALVPQTTTLLLGESGAGKSTLVNALLGAEVLGTASVRDRDDQGRHTTVARRMLKVPHAGVIVDAPGLRSLPLLDEESGLARAFPDIDGLVGGCRFRDCTHGQEPGCAVRAACARGDVSPERLEEYRALVAEMRANRLSLDPAAKSSITV